jgi:hypothetical protein
MENHCSARRGNGATTQWQRPARSRPRTLKNLRAAAMRPFSFIAPAHPRNIHRRAPVRCGRARQSRHPIPRTASPRALRLIFRRTCSTSEKPVVSLKATSPSVANSGRPVANEPDDATIAAASVAARANLLVSKSIDDPGRWGQFDTNYFQHR